jgi:hypothetical protein
VFSLSCRFVAGEERHPAKVEVTSSGACPSGSDREQLDPRLLSPLRLASAWLGRGGGGAGCRGFDDLLGVEAQAPPWSLTNPAGAESIGVLVDPAAIDPEPAGDLGGVDQSLNIDRLLVEEFGHSLSDGLDGLVGDGDGALAHRPTSRGK